MADPTARAIVAETLALRASHPAVPALDVLDQVMRGYRGTSPEFDAGRQDLTDAGTPFGEVLRLAFAPGLEEADGATWEELVVDAFAARYDLGSAAP